ncbi:GNAT family N-acetyltransferase [Vagococcus elongatus]|uniref:N-acetyltransferase domain-containing protein n=1 Tax=Vagococcus elongatus TaxID=180344 RepID=A0A430AX41_9ENTE|nr:GNAT family N-acetyltransferase [Vagococcus elongatus]RSU12630.1 hypothetical protein CBF29_05740 [Vagococcus elongatus]
MEIRKALRHEETLVNDMLKGAALRIKNKQSEQWSNILEDKELPVIRHWLGKDSIYFGEIDQQVIAVCYLYQEMTDWDRELWEQHPTDTPCLYLHKLTLAEGQTGKGLAHKFLSVLQDYVKLNFESGTLIRLDCIGEKEMLNQLYQSSGFHKVGMTPQVYNGVLMADFNLFEWRP